MCSPWKLAFDNVMESYQKTQQKFSLSIFSCEMEYNFQCNTYMKENMVQKEYVFHMLESTEMIAYRTQEFCSLNYQSCCFLLSSHAVLHIPRPHKSSFISINFSSIGFLHSDRISTSPGFQFLAHSPNFSYQLSPLV